MHAINHRICSLVIVNSNVEQELFRIILKIEEIDARMRYEAIFISEESVKLNRNNQFKLINNFNLYYVTKIRKKGDRQTNRVYRVNRITS